MKFSKLTITLGILCVVLLISNVSFFLYFFVQDPPEPQNPIVIQKASPQISEEDLRQAIKQTTRENHEDMEANETSFMAFLLTFIGTMTTLTGIAFTVYHFFQASKVRDLVDQGIQDGMNRLGTEYGQKVEKKYFDRLMEIETFSYSSTIVLQKLLFAIEKSRNFESRHIELKRLDLLLDSLMSYYCHQNYRRSHALMIEFINYNPNFATGLRVSLFYLFIHTGMVEKHIDTLFELSLNYPLYYRSHHQYILEYLNPEQRDKLFSLAYDDNLLANERDWVEHAYDHWIHLFEKPSANEITYRNIQLNANDSFS